MNDLEDNEDICSEMNDLIFKVKMGNMNDPVLVSRLYGIGLRFENGDGAEQSDEQAGSCYEIVAEYGIPDAQFRLGLMYETGYGEELNIPKARYWYEKAIENGYTKAICRLGVTYYDDEDDPGAAEKAFYWLNRSAELSDAEGCYYLAMCYQHGIGTEKSISLALKYMKKAKELGYPAAESPTEMIRHMDVN